MKKVCLLFLLTSICVVCFTGKTPQSQIQEGRGQDRKFMVVVVVDCADESLKNLAESHIKRELRSLGDVVIAKTIGEGLFATHYEIHMLISELTNTTGGKSKAVTIASLFLRRFDNTDLLDNYVKPESRDLASLHTIGLYHSPSKELRVAYWYRHNIVAYCQNLVAQFDIRMLEKAR